MLVATEESADIEAVREELCDAMLIPDVEPIPAYVSPLFGVDFAVKDKSVPVDVGLIMHVDVPLCPADKLDIVLQA